MTGRCPVPRAMPVPISLTADAHFGARLSAFFYWTRCFENNVPFDNTTLSVSVCIIIQTSIYLFCFCFFNFLWLNPYICGLLYCDSFGLYSCMYLVCYLVLWPPGWINATTTTTPIYLINLLSKLGLGFRLDSELHYTFENTNLFNLINLLCVDLVILINRSDTFNGTMLSMSDKYDSVNECPQDRDQRINEITYSRGVTKCIWNLLGNWLMDTNV